MDRLYVNFKSVSPAIYKRLRDPEAVPLEYLSPLKIPSLMAFISGDRTELINC